MELRIHSHPVRTDDQMLLIQAVVIDTEHYRTESTIVLIDVNISGTKTEEDVQGKHWQ